MVQKYLDFLCSKETTLTFENLNSALIQEMIGRVKSFKISLGAIKVDREDKNLIISKKGRFKPELAKLQVQQMLRVQKEVNQQVSEDFNESDQTDDHTQQEESKDLSSMDIQIKTSLDKEAKDIFRREYGFTYAAEIILNSKKPIVGHNCFFDMMYFMSQFVLDLPSSFDSLVKQWKQFKINLYDTKLISHHIKDFDKTALDSIFERIKMSQKFNEIAKFSFDTGFDRYRQVGKEHEAAYDAYMTGYVFATLVKHKEIEDKYKAAVCQAENSS